MERFLNMVLSDKTHAKLTIGTFISLIIVIIGGTWGAAVYIGNLKYDIKNNKDLITYSQDDIIDMQAENKERDRDMKNIQINQAKIDEKLLNIEVGILEIKSILKDK